jgi:hypothetical protein
MSQENKNHHSHARLGKERYCWPIDHNMGREQGLES